MSVTRVVDKRNNPDEVVLTSEEETSPDSPNLSEFQSEITRVWEYTDLEFLHYKVFNKDKYIWMH